MPGSRCVTQRTHKVVPVVAITAPNRITRSWPPSRRTERTEEMADSVLTQHSSPDSQSLSPVNQDVQSSAPVVSNSQSHIGPDSDTPPSPPEIAITHLQLRSGSSGRPKS